MTTHNLPLTAGLSDGRVYGAAGPLGLLNRPVEEEQAAADASRETWLAELRSGGLLPASGTPSLEGIVVALHHYLSLRLPS